MGILRYDEILELHETVTSVVPALSRDALLGGIDPHFRNEIRQGNSPVEQFLADLEAMNGAESLVDGSVPLVIWLKNAIALVAPRPQAATFQAKLDHCQAAIAAITRARLLGAGGPATTPAGPATTPAGPASFLDTARGKRPYALSAVSMHVRLEDVSTPEGARRLASVRIVYTVLALEPIALDNSSFTETYGSSHTENGSVALQHWYGSEVERLNGKAAPYYVQFSAAAGESRTVITGADLVFPLPLPPDREEMTGTIRLRDDEDLWVYFNDADYIGELLMVIESPTTDLTPVGRGAARLAANLIDLRWDSARRNPEGGGAGASLSARWTNILPGEKVGIQFSWPASP
jgi:hypothetical protein